MPNRTLIPAVRGAAPIPIVTPNTTLRRRIGESLRRMTTVEETGSGAEALGILERRSARIIVVRRLGAEYLRDLPQTGIAALLLSREHSSRRGAR